MNFNGDVFRKTFILIREETDLSETFRATQEQFGLPGKQNGKSWLDSSHRHQQEITNG